MKALKMHRAAIGYTLDYLKGISPTLCQHKIKLDEGSKPVRDHQRRLNPNMKEVEGGTNAPRDRYNLSRC